MQHKLESGYKSVRQQQSISLLLSLQHRAPLYHFQQLPVFLGGSGVQEIAGGKASKSSQTAQILSGLLLVNIMLIFKKNPQQQTKTQEKPKPSLCPAVSLDQILLPSKESMLSLLCRAPAPTAAAGATGRTFTDSLCQTQPGINIMPGPVFQSCLSWAARGVPKARDSSALCS